ncbi:tRNA-queuosine alpha-mannosyltransferase isoform X2 [Myripristis murdjan]|nr:glycosyltransferase-like domain-containing protein 1 isoform X2 [Myripristis murdjan]
MNVLLVEAFYGGSHKQLIDLLKENVEGCIAYTLPAKKWHWRARTAALHFMQSIPASSSYRVLFTSSVLNLCELVALRPDLASLKKVLYFHENQLVYPVRKVQERDFQYGYNQVLSCLVADVVVFNSFFNMESFLSSISCFMRRMPDYHPKDLDKVIRPKCQVLHFPLQFPDVTRFLPNHKLLRRAAEVSHVDGVSALQGQQQHSQDDPQASWPEELASQARDVCLNPEPGRGKLDQEEDLWRSPSNPENQGAEGEKDVMAKGIKGVEGQTKPLHIVWPHRWEHDKNPELLFRTLLKLKERDLDFQLSVLGETFTDVPEIFAEARVLLDAHILHWGFLPSKDDYFRVLCQADVVVSTAKHEFFGIAMLEAVHCGCYPLCPKSLVYPEIFPAEYLYSTPEQLCKRLQGLCRRPHVARRHNIKVNTTAYSWVALKEGFKSLLTGQGYHCS